jgi:hypothetical protein
LTAITRSNTSTGMSAMGATMPSMPALQNSTSTRPWRCSVVASMPAT